MNGSTFLARHARVLGVAVACTVLLAVAWQTRSAHIQASLPYCRQTDEAHWVRAALHTVRTGDLNPHRFTKPSLQFYVTTAAISLGLIRTGARGESGYRPQRLEQDAYPYYRSRTAILTARQAFAAISLGAIALGMLLVWRLTGSGGSMVLSLALSLLSPLYFSYSWSYINVDVLGVCCAMATLVFLISQHDRTGPFAYAAISGALSGLTIGSKYNLFPILCPAMLAVVLYHRKRWFALSCVVLLATTLVFLMTTPYALFDLSSFVKNAAYEAHHYATGHKDKTVEAGAPMFFSYVANAVENMGLGVVTFGLLGAAVIARRDVRTAAILFSYPVLLLLYMSAQRVFFERNILIWHLLLPLLAGPGISFAYQWLRVRLERLERRPVTGRRGQLLAAVSLFALLAAFTPWSRVVQGYDTRVESRNLVTHFLKAELPKRTQILVPEQLALDAGPLKQRFRIVKFDATNVTLKALRRQHRGAVALIPEFEERYRKKTVDLSDLSPSGPKVLAEFGHYTLSLEYKKAHHQVIYSRRGDPHLAVVRL